MSFWGYQIGRTLALKNRIAKRSGTNSKRSLTSWATFVFLCAFFAGLTGASLFSTDTASAETRSLKLYFTHTRESATITFKKNGRYLPGGLKKLNRFLRDWRRNEPTRMDPRLFDLIWEVYRKTGSNQPIKVVSGYRSPKTNAALRRRGRGVATKSQHTKGRALDFFIPGVSVDKIRALGLRAHAGGVGYYRGSFVHLDTGSVRHWPRMTRRQLAKVFPKGRTLHVPTDGKPMAGYNYALAKYKKRKRTGGPVLLASSQSSSSGPTKSFFKRIFGGGQDEKEESASIRVASKKTAKKNGRTAKSRNGKKSGSALPGVTLADGPSAAERATDEVVTKIPVLPNRVIIPTARPGSIPATADTGIAFAQNSSGSQSAATVVASRFDSRGPVVPVLRPSLKIENSRFALAAAPELTPTQKAAAALAASKPRPQFIAAKPVSPDRFEYKAAADEKLLLAMLGPARSITIPQKSPSPTQVATGGEVPLNILTLPTAMPQRNSQPLAKDEPENNNSPLAKPIQANRIDRAFAALSTKLSVTPRSRPGTGFNPVRSTIPTRKTERTARASVDNHTKPKTKTSSLAVSHHLQLGNLDGSDVTEWAISYSTRVGHLAKLTAPRYLGILKNAPVAIFNNGFDEKQIINRTNRFSGQAIKRIEFAKFVSADLSHNQVFPTDRY